MSLYSRDVRKQFLTIGGVDIPPSGMEEFVSFARGAQNTVERGVSNYIVQPEPITEDMMIVTVYPEEPASAILEGIFRRDRAVVAAGSERTKLAISFRNADNGQRVVAADAIPTQGAAVSGSKKTKTVTYTFQLIDAQYSQVQA